jgi:hypothetical protein
VSFLYDVIDEVKVWKFVRVLALSLVLHLGVGTRIVVRPSA